MLESIRSEIGDLFVEILLNKVSGTHIYNEGSVTIFFGALFYPSAHNARRRVK